MQMSEAAKKALMSAKSNRQGESVHGVDAWVLGELSRRGLVGAGGGLTRLGSIERERLESADLDALFGPE